MIAWGWRIGLVIVVCLANWLGATAVYTFTTGPETMAHVKTCSNPRNPVCRGTWTGPRGRSQSGQIFGVGLSDIGRDVRIRPGPLGAIAVRAWNLVLGLSFLALLGDMTVVVLLVRWRRKPKGWLIA
jgi:hypothetical protein